MDILTEKSNTISRCGSFYYQTLEDETKDLAEFISHITWYNKIPSKLKKIEEALKGGAFFLSYYDVIKFNDKDVSWRGIKEALQYRVQGPATRKVDGEYESAPDTKRYPGRLANLTINNSVVAEANEQDVYTATENESTILYPKEGETIVLPETIVPKWDITIDDNIYVISIILDGKVLITGQDFESDFGKLTFLKNPITLFPAKKILVLCSQVRFKNIYNYIIGATNIYGDISYVLKYYRTSQTINTLKLACAQFAGLTVVKEPCKIVAVKKHDIGATYITNNGVLDARYNHNVYKAGTTLNQDTVIGGNSLFNIYSNYDAIKNKDITISLNGILPITGLYASNLKEMEFNVVKPNTTTNIYVPLFSGNSSSLEAYKKYAISIGGVSPNLANNIILNKAPLLPTYDLELGEVPYEDIFIEETTGTYANLSFANITGSSSGTSGTCDAPITLTIIISGNAVVTSFLDGGAGLLGWTGASASVVMYSNINVIISTSESVSFINMTGESNSSGSFKIIGDLTASIESGEVGVDEASVDSEAWSLCAGCKGMVLKGNNTFNIGVKNSIENKPIINGAIIGSLEQRNGGATGTHEGLITINLYNGTYNGNIYAIGKKGQTICTYTVNYFDGEFAQDKKIKISEGGNVYGEKILNIKESGELNSSYVDYYDFDTINIDSDAKFIMTGDIILGSSTITNKGTIDFSGVTSCEVADDKIRENSHYYDSNDVITSNIVLASGGTYVAYEALGAAFSVNNNNLLYTISAKVNGWDINWGVLGLQGSNNVTDLPIGVDLQENVFLPNYEEYVTSSGDTEIKLVEEHSSSSASVFGGKLAADFVGNTWIYSEGGTYNKLVGGTSSNGSRANFTGNSHIYVKNSTINHLYGGIHADAGSPIMDGNSFITIDSNTNIPGWVIGGNVLWHANTTTFNGSTNIYIYVPLTGTLAPSDLNGPNVADTAIVGGNAWLRNFAGTSTLNGNTSINIIIKEAQTSNANNSFSKLVVGGSLIGAATAGSIGYGYVNGNTHVYINVSKDITFTNSIIGSGLIESVGNNVYVHGGNSNIELNGGIYANSVIGNSYVKRGSSTTYGKVTSVISNGTFNANIIAGGRIERDQTIIIKGTTELLVTDCTTNSTIIGGSYENAGASTVKSEDVSIIISGGVVSDIVGGHYTTGDGTISSADVSIENITIEIKDKAVINGSIYGGIVLQRCAGENDIMRQNNINIILRDTNINNNIYAAGGDYINEAATSVLKTESTRLELSNETILKNGIIISGGYVGMENSATSVISGNRTLALAGTSDYDISSVVLKDFNTIEVTEENAVVNINVSLTDCGIVNKVGKGTYKLLDNESVNILDVNEGTLKLGNNITARQLNINNTSIFDAVTGTISGSVNLNEGSTLKVEANALKMTDNSTLRINGKINIIIATDTAQSKNFYSIKLVEGASHIFLGNEEIENGQYVNAASYIKSIVDINAKDIDFSNAYFKLEDNILYIHVNDSSIIQWGKGSELQYVMTELLNNSLFLVKYDKSLLTDSMIIDIKTFIDREKPVGSFISYLDDVIDV